MLLHKQKNTESLFRILDCEIRGCLQSIMANTELLKQENAHKLDRKAIHYLNKIEGSCEVLDDLIVKSLSAEFLDHPGWSDDKSEDVGSGEITD